MPQKDPEVRRAYLKAYRAAHPEERKGYDAKYYLKHKSQIDAKHQSYYEANRRTILERRAPKRARSAAYQVAYRAAHPEIVREMSQRKRARKLQAPINDLTAAEWREIKEAYKHRCVYCGRKMQKLTQDHLTPLSKGGSHTKQNVVPACRSCNSQKNAGPVLKPVQPLLL